MTVVAYACIDPYVEAVPQSSEWGQIIDQLYIDHRRSVEPQSQLQQLLQDAAAQPPETLLVRRLGELGASPMAVLACVEQLENYGVAIQALDASYCTHQDGELALNRQTIVELAVKIESQQRRQRLTAGHAQNRIHVLPPPGRAPYGYRRGRDRYALDRTSAPVVKAFFEQFLLFGSIRGAVRYLEKTYGKRISASTGQRWLTHPVYRGDLLYKDGNIIRDTHTAIISREEAAQVDRLLRRNRRLAPKTASAQRSLAGLVQCRECQSWLKISRVTRPRQSQEYLYLRPIRCGRSQHPCKAISYGAVLEKTIEQVCADLPDAIANLQAPPVDSIKGVLLATVQQKEATLQQIPDLLSQGILDATTASLRTYTLRSELSELEQQISQLPPQNLLQIVQTLSIRQFWLDLSEPERRVYLREFIDRVLITRAQDTWTIQIQFVF
ncbi:MAG: recombinase family protein [Cyanobacteria bacterium P01_H01_bin.58]